HVAQSQLQAAELRMVVHAERVRNVQAVSSQQLQAVAGFLEAPSHRLEPDVVAPGWRGLCGGGALPRKDGAKPRHHTAIVFRDRRSVRMAPRSEVLRRTHPINS